MGDAELPVRTILLTADFSNPAKAAAQQAKLLAGHFGATLKLLHVLSYPLSIPGAPNLGLRLGEWFTARAEQEIAAFKEFFAAELGGARVEYVVLEGDPAGRIAEYANANRVDLIVIPAYGQGPFRRLLLGSVTAKVLHDVECPVWTGIHREELPSTERLDIGNIVCAVALDEQSPKLVAWASAAAASFDARLFLVHAVPHPDTGDDLRPEWMEPAVTRARERLEKLNLECGAGAICIVCIGHIQQEVCHQAQELGAGLLVIGRSPQPALVGRLPTHAYAIIRDSPCPVVSV